MWLRAEQPWAPHGTLWRERGSGLSTQGCSHCSSSRHGGALTPLQGSQAQIDALGFTPMLQWGAREPLLQPQEPPPAPWQHSAHGRSLTWGVSSAEPQVSVLWSVPRGQPVPICRGNVLPTSDASPTAETRTGEPGHKPTTHTVGCSLWPGCLAPAPVATTLLHPAHSQLSTCWLIISIYSLL